MKSALFDLNFGCVVASYVNFLQVCDILADSPEGVSASIKIETFKEIYTYLFER